MPTIINPDTLVFKDDPKVLKEFALKTLYPRLFKIAGSTHFVFDIRQLDPGLYSFPYHFHRAAEELIMILSGSFTLRTKDGFKIINKGELLFFEIGETGAHQFYNHDTVPCIYLDIRTTIGIDISEHLDSGKVYIIKSDETYEKASRVNYNKGEEHIQDIWEKLRQQSK
jgi:uncharacterized cupin superfamily protein